MIESVGDGAVRHSTKNNFSKDAGYWATFVILEQVP